MGTPRSCWGLLSICFAGAEVRRASSRGSIKPSWNGRWRSSRWGRFGQLDKELLKFPWFTPVAIEIFGGKFDPATLSFPYNLLPALKQMPPSDARDWTAIRAWALGLAAQLQPRR